MLETLYAKDIINAYENQLDVDCEKLFDIQMVTYHHCLKCDLRFFNPLVTGDEKFYNALQKHDWYYLEDKQEYVFAQKYIHKDDVVLDVGCGEANFAKFVNDKQAEFIGLDFSVNAKELANQQGITIYNQSIQEYAKNNPNSLDVVTSFQVLEHVDNPRGFIQAKIDALKSDGVMIVAVPSEDSFLSKCVNGVLNMPPHHVTRWSDESLRSIAEIFNLELIEISHESVQPIHYQFYWNVILQSKINQHALIDNSLKRKISNRISSTVSKIMSRVSKPINQYGHTVVAVYRKK